MRSRVLLGVATIALIGVAGSWWLIFARSPTTQPSIVSKEEAADANASPIRFTDIIADLGIDFRHQDGATPMQYSPEVLGSGVAWLDYDRDGFYDLFLVQGGRFPPDRNESPTQPTSRLYRNLGNGTFADVTSQVGIHTPGYGQGVAVGDYDNDGYPDLFVTNFDGGRLYHNEAAGDQRRFRDVCKEAGISLEGWCTSCAFGDVHGNGHLDLFVCRYVDIDLNAYPECHEQGKTGLVRTACGPRYFRGTRSFLLRNNGNGTFTDISTQARLDADGKALGVVILDLDDDGRNDIFVGNDEVLNHHFRNLGDGRFQSIGLIAGTGATHRGRPMGSMGIEAGNMTGAGRPDLFITTFYHEGTVLFKNRGNGMFTDISSSAGMFAASWEKVGWGTALFDPDNDGRLELFVANGHTHRNAGELMEAENGKSPETAQLPQLFSGDGLGRFRDISAPSGPYFHAKRVGRGAAQCDFDNDGRIDLAVTHVGGTPSILRNTTATSNHWVRLELEGARHRDANGSSRDAIGAVVTVRAGGQTQVHFVKGGGSYYSAHEQRLLIGVGAAESIDEVRVQWPNKARSVQTFRSLAVDRSYKLSELISEPIAANCPRFRSAP
jgi:hypothetical protein